MKSHLRLLRGKITNAHREFKVRLRSGAERWIDVNEVRTTWEGESAALTFATDITERKQSQDALQKSEKRFRALIANAGDLIVVIDMDGIIQFASPSSERILGYKPEDAIGINFTEWVHPDDLSVVLESLVSRSKGVGLRLRV
jgi:PAS domain-containing protein